MKLSEIKNHLHTAEAVNFVLLTKETNCLAQDKCGIPAEQLKTTTNSSCCTPAGGCC